MTFGRRASIGCLMAALTALVWASPSEAGTRETLRQECKTQLNMPDPICDCIGKKAETELSAGEQAMVVAMVTKDKAAQARSRGTLSGDEMAKAALFMANAPQDCAKPKQ